MTTPAGESPLAHNGGKGEAAVMDIRKLMLYLRQQKTRPGLDSLGAGFRVCICCAGRVAIVAFATVAVKEAIDHV